jgi:hypothetical protein
MEIAADGVQEALGAELVPVEEGDDGNRRQDQRPQRFFLGSQAQVPAGKQRQRHGAYQDAYTDFERTVRVEYKARPGDAGDEAWARSKHSDALPSSFFGRNDECQGTIDERCSPVPDLVSPSGHTGLSGLGFPNSTWEASNYYVDVLFMPAGSASRCQPATTRVMRAG